MLNYINQSDFKFATLSETDFTRATLLSNRFNGASLVGASFDQADWGTNAYWLDSSKAPTDPGVPMPSNDFGNAVGLDESVRELASGRPAKPKRFRMAKPIVETP